MKYVVTRTIEHEIDAPSLDDARQMTRLKSLEGGAIVHLSITAIGK